MNKTDQNLKVAIASNERIALWSAGGVIFGLVLEVILAAAFHPPPETLVSHWGPVAASTIVALGVISEVWFGRKSRIDSEELTRRSEDRLTNATNSAAQANERAATLEKEAAEARERTAEIERITQWRRVSLEQTEAIVQEIRRKIPRNVVIRIECVNDPEAIMFADQLGDLFMKAETGRAERFASPMPADGRVEFGLFISSEPEVYSIIMTEAFNKAGIPITKWVTAFGGRPRMTLYVGHKPEYRQHI